MGRGMLKKGTQQHQRISFIHKCEENISVWNVSVTCLSMFIRKDRSTEADLLVQHGRKMEERCASSHIDDVHLCSVFLPYLKIRHWFLS